MSRRYRAPQKNGELLIDPPFDAVPGLIEENQKKLDRNDVRIGGISLRVLREQVRQSGPLPNSSPSTVGRNPAPIIITGHQPELFHPGVWVKNFAAAGLAKRVNGHAVHIIVDNDTVHSTNLTVPHLDSDPAHVRLQIVPFDRPAPETAYEYRPVYDATLFNTFPDRLSDEFAGWPFEPLLPDTWLKKLRDERILELFITARTSIEAELHCLQWTGCVSHFIQCDPWLVFVRHLLADTERFTTVHNAALATYRKENKLRSRTHPFPDLAPNEAPFWVLDVAGKRKRCFIPYTGDPKALRPRALTLTLFARLVLGDFFIHGIGGGKYDDVTDRIIRDYFGIDPPAYQVVTGTLHLPFPPFPHSTDDVKRLELLRRDLDWNPHRHLTAEQRARHDVAAPLAKRDELSRATPTGRDARRQHFRNRRAVVEALRLLVAGRIRDVDRDLAAVRAEAAANAVLFRRDYAWVLYPRDVLIPFLKHVHQLAGGKR